MEFTGLVRLWFCAVCNSVIAWPTMVGEHHEPTTSCPTCRGMGYPLCRRWVALIGDKIVHGLVPDGGEKS